MMTNWIDDVRLTFELPWSASSVSRFSTFETRAWRERAEVVAIREASLAHSGSPPFDASGVLGLMRCAGTERPETSVRRIAEAYIGALERVTYDDLGFHPRLAYGSTESVAGASYPDRIYATMPAERVEEIRLLSWTPKNHRVWTRELDLDPRNGTYQRLIGSMISSWTDAERGAVLRAVIDARSVENRTLMIMEEEYSVDDLVDWERYREAFRAIWREDAQADIPPPSSPPTMP